MSQIAAYCELPLVVEPWTMLHLPVLRPGCWQWGDLVLVHDHLNVDPICELVDDDDGVAICRQGFAPLLVASVLAEHEPECQGHERWQHLVVDLVYAGQYEWYMVLLRLVVAGHISGQPLQVVELVQAEDVVRLNVHFHENKCQDP